MEFDLSNIISWAAVIRHCLVLIALCELIELLSEKQLEAWLSEGHDRARKCMMDLNY